MRWSKFADEGLFVQSMLLSKALQMQKDLEKKDFLLQAMEGSLAEVQAENARLNKELLQNSESFEQERKSLQTK